MANTEQLGYLKKDVDEWNTWREKNREVAPDLASADLASADLRMANLNATILTKANLVMANLSGADLRDANLSGANLVGARLIGVDLEGAEEDDDDEAAEEARESLVGAEKALATAKTELRVNSAATRSRVVHMVSLASRHCPELLRHGAHRAVDSVEVIPPVPPCPFGGSTQAPSGALGIEAGLKDLLPLVSAHLGVVYNLDAGTWQGCLELVPEGRPEPSGIRRAQEQGVGYLILDE